AVRAEGDAIRPVAARTSTLQRKEFQAGLRIPHFDLAPEVHALVIPGVTCGGQAFAVRAIRHIEGRTLLPLWPLEGEDLLVTESVEIIPFEVTQVRFTPLGAVEIQQL